MHLEVDQMGGGVVSNRPVGWKQIKMVQLGARIAVHYKGVLRHALFYP